jgi:hypothetical protein
MSQNRSGNLLHSLMSPFRKTGKHESETPDPNTPESRRRLEQRIELALANTTDPATERA